MIKSPKSSRDCFRNRAIAADRGVDRRLRDRLSSGALFFVDLIFAHGVFFTFRVCHARDLAWELVNGDDGGGPPVGVYGTVAARNEDGVPMCLINTSMATYITTYKAINTKLIGWVPSSSARDVSS